MPCVGDFANGVFGDADGMGGVDVLSDGDGGGDGGGRLDGTPYRVVQQCRSDALQRVIFVDGKSAKDQYRCGSGQFLVLADGASAWRIAPATRQ